MLAIAVTILIVSVCSLLLVGMAFAYLRTGVPTIASSRLAQSQIAEVLRERGAKKIYELGSGTGGFSFRLATEVSGAEVVGVEISPLAYLYAQAWRLIHPARRQVRFVLGSIERQNLRDADAVAFYLMPNAVKKLTPKFVRELRPGTTVATVSFALRDWQPEKSFVTPNFTKTRSYIYTMPPKTKTPA